MLKQIRKYLTRLGHSLTFKLSVCSGLLSFLAIGGLAWGMFRIQREALTGWMTVLLALSIFTAVSILWGILLYFFLHRPLKKVVRGAQALARRERSVPIRVPNSGELEKMAQVFNDLRDEAVQREMALMHHDRLAAIGMVVTGMTHNIKNILNGLEGGVFVVNSALEDDNREGFKRGWEMVQRNVTKISNLANDLLMYAKDRRPVLTHVSLNEIIEETIEDITPYASKYQVAIRRDLDPNIGLVHLDRPGIYRCILNLAANAVDACSELDLEKAAFILFKTRRLGSHRITIEIRDNGVGMDKAVQKEIFTSFFSTKGYKGTGLGLLAARKVIDEHGGRITVASEPGHGSVFTIYLPDPPLPEQDQNQD